MTRLNKLGHKILFVDPPINTGRLFGRQLLKGKWTLKKLITGIKKDEGILVYSPLDYSTIHERHALSHAKKIQKLTKKFFDPNQKTIIWFYHVEIAGLEQYLKNIEHDFLIYDCVDNYAGFPKYDTPEKKEVINKKEQTLAVRANVIFATAPGLVEKLKKFNANTFYMPNVGDFEKFYNIKERINEIPKEMQAIPRPVIGFTGAVDEYKFDNELFRKIATDYPKYSFVLIGPIALKDREGTLKELGLSDLPNVYFLGTKPYSEIQNYTAAFDAAIIPYKLNDYTVGGCFPVKFHDSLAAGLPVVVTNLPAYTPFINYCYVAKSYNEFSQDIRKAIEEDSKTKILERQQVAKQNNWDGKVESMLDIVKRYLA